MAKAEQSSTEFEYREHFGPDGQVASSGLRKATIRIADEDLGDREVLIHEAAHVVVRGFYGPTVDVHGTEFVDIKDRLREELGFEATGDIW